jgi:TPR repeat protein
MNECESSIPRLPFAALLLAAAVCLSSAATAQESWAVRCNGLPGNADRGMVEFCAGIAAMSGNNGESTQDPQAALQHYRNAADLGFAEAQATLGRIYERGFQDIAPDPAQAAQWYAKAAAQGHAGAELNLGNLYAKGAGVPKDPAKARQLIQAAADQGLAPAQTALAQLSGQSPAAAPGADLFQRAVALYNSGDHAGAATLVRQAAEAGNPTATYEMGYMFENGDGLALDSAQAAQWYLKAAQLGDAAGEAAVGQLYEAGNQVNENWDTAAQWYMRSAQQGNRMGEFRLGRAYHYGVGLPLDLGAAEQWYDKAAAQGDSQAAYFAKYIRDNHGFDRSSYSDEEQAIMAPYMMQPYMLHPPPFGRVFHNHEQRLDYFRAWAAAADAYGQCMVAHTNAPAGTTFTCPAPLPPN